MTISGKPKSLLEFATGDRRDIAWLTQRPEWPDCVAGYKDGVRPYTIRNWLVRECGYNDKQLPSADTIARELRNNHERDTA